MMVTKPLIEYLPEFLREYREFQRLAAAEQPEIDRLHQAVEAALDNQFVETADEYGVERWEQIMKLAPKTGQTLDDRKFEILVKLNEDLPYTYTALAANLRQLCGDDGYTLDADYDKYTLTVKLALGVKSQFDSVAELFARMLPANLDYTVTLLYNTHQLLAAYSHQELAAYTHEQLRSEVMNSGN